MVGKSSPVLRRTRCHAGVIIKQGPRAGVWKALPTHRQGKSPRPARSAAVASFHPSIPTLPGAQRKEEASCQRVTQIARCSTAPPALGTPPVPKPSPHHATPPKPSCPPLPSHRTSHVRRRCYQLYFSKAKAQAGARKPGSNQGCWSTSAWATAEREQPSNFICPEMPWFSGASSSRCRHAPFLVEDE